MEEYKFFIKRTGEKFNNQRSFINRVRYIYKGTRNSSEACYLENNGMSEPPKCSCGEYRRFKNFITGYDVHCGNPPCVKKSSKIALQKARKNEGLFRDKHKLYIAENIDWYIENCNKRKIVEPFLNKNIGNVTLLEFLKNSKLGLRIFWNNFLKSRNINTLCLSCLRSIAEEYEIFDLENCKRNICSKCEKLYELTPELTKEIDTKDKLFDYIYENFEKYNTDNFSERVFKEMRRRALKYLKANAKSDESLEEKIKNHNKIIIKTGKAYRYNEFKTFNFKGYNVTYYPHREFGNLIKKYSPFLKEFLYVHCSKCGKESERHFLDIIKETFAEVAFCSKKCYFAAKADGSYIQPVSEATREKLSNNMKMLIANGILKPSITDTWTKTRIEYCGNKFRSSWELCFSLLNPFFEYEKHRIQYIKENGEKSTYIVDFSDFHNNILYEIKPLRVYEDNINNQLKEKAAQNWCNENGWKYEIINELYFKAKIKELEVIIADDENLTPEMVKVIQNNIKSWSKICA